MNTFRLTARNCLQRAIRSSGAFTLLELLVVLAVISLLASIMFPALSRSQPLTRAAQCANNNRQLCHAWRMYADDSRDQIVYASDDGSGSANPLNQYAWTQAHLDRSPVNRVNWDTSYVTNAPLWPYSHGSLSIYRCPSDRSSVLVNGSPLPRTRSFSMNVYLGGFASTDGGWPFMASYRIFLKTTDLTAPGPASTFVFLDQRPDSINWGNFLTEMSGFSPPNDSLYNLQDVPGYFHDGGSTVSFADCHVELKRWSDPRTTPPTVTVGAQVASPRNPDIGWLQHRATSLK